MGGGQWLTHLAQRNPGASVLSTTEYNLKHLCTVMGTGREGKVGIVVGLHCHLELVHLGWFFDILIFIFVRGGNVNSL